MRKTVGYVAESTSAELKLQELSLASLRDDQVCIEVEHCGICHSDLLMHSNAWGMTSFPFVPGHEIVGRVVELGRSVTNLSIGDRVGVGWFSGSCSVCESCMGGDHNLCNQAESVIVGRYGGFAKHVHVQSKWAIPIPSKFDSAPVGPLFCAGMTIFNPLIQCNVSPLHKVGIIGVGGLGHLGIKFVAAWGCEVSVFSSNPSKQQETLAMGAHRFFVINSNVELSSELNNYFDLLLVTSLANLEWSSFLKLLHPKGRIHFLSTPTLPISLPVFPLLVNQLTVSGSPLGSPTSMLKMLKFAALHKIEPTVEKFSFTEVNEALAHVEEGKARYRAVLAW